MNRMDIQDALEQFRGELRGYFEYLNEWTTGFTDERDKGRALDALQDHLVASIDRIFDQVREGQQEAVEAHLQRRVEEIRGNGSLQPYSEGGSR